MRSFRRDYYALYGGNRPHYIGRDRQRPRSHSPTPQLHRRSVSPPYPSHYNRYRGFGYRPYTNRYSGGFYHNRSHYRGSSFRSDWQPWQRKRFTWHVNDSSRRMSDSPRKSFSPQRENSESKRTKLDSGRQSPQVDGTANADARTAYSAANAYAACLEEAKKIFNSDCQTVAEVTQLLISEDQELEERLIPAMKSCLQRLKNAHLRHIELVRTLHSSDVETPVKSVYNVPQ